MRPDFFTYIVLLVCFRNYNTIDVDIGHLIKTLRVINLLTLLFKHSCRKGTLPLFAASCKGKSIDSVLDSTKIEKCSMKDNSIILEVIEYT